MHLFVHYQVFTKDLVFVFSGLSFKLQKPQTDLWHRTGGTQVVVQASYLV